MNDAEIAEIRELYKGVDDPAVHALLAHIDFLDASMRKIQEMFTQGQRAQEWIRAERDAQAAEITDREGKYVDLLRTKHALTAEVERLKMDAKGAEYNEGCVMADLEAAKKENESLRAFLREVRCPHCLKAVAWQKQVKQ